MNYKMAQTLGRHRSFSTVVEAWKRIPSPLVLGVTLLFAYLFRLSLTPIIGEQFPYATFYLAVVVVTAQGGARFGILATGISYCSGSYFFAERTLIPMTLVGFVGSAIYILNCAIIIALIEAQGTAYRAMQAHALALEIESAERAAVEKQHQELEVRYRTLSELTSDFAYGARVEPDKTVRVEWINDTYTRITGWTADDINRLGISNLVFTEDRELASELMKRVMAGEETLVELRIVTQDKQVIWVRHYARPLEKDADGNVLCYVGAAQDITAQKKSKNEPRPHCTVWNSFSKGRVWEHGNLT